MAEQSLKNLIYFYEPTGVLDSKTSRKILKFIEDAHEKYGTTIIMVTHNERIQYMADRIITILDGQILTDLKSQYVGTVIDEETLMVVVKQLDSSIGAMMQVMTIATLCIYLLK